MYIIPELQKDVLLHLPPRSILKFRAVSKHWKSILESRDFEEKRKILRKGYRRKILAAYNCDCGGRPRLLPNCRLVIAEVVTYLHCDAKRPSMNYDGLMCYIEQDWIIILNPSTGQLRRFPSGLNSHLSLRYQLGLWSKFSPEKWAMGFGRDEVTGKYKFVRMCSSYWEFGRRYEPVVECSVLDVETGEWRKLNPPHHVVIPGSKSVCVNGSIYWLHFDTVYKILALDLHKEEFHEVPFLDAMRITEDTQIGNLEGRLAIAETRIGNPWKLIIWSMNTVKEIWFKNFSISLANRVVSEKRQGRWFTPVMVSKKFVLVFHDNQNRLFKYYPTADKVRCLSLDTCVISPYVENLVPLPFKSSHPHTYVDFKTRVTKCRLFPKESNSWISKVLQGSGSRILDVMFASLVVVGYIWSPV